MKNYKEQLNKLLDNSYAPYSGFNVASIIVMKDGTEFPGVNVESASFSTTNCAERTGIFSAIASGQKSGDVKEVHIIARNKDGLVAATPCGPCRQVIAEQSAGQAKIFIYKADDSVFETTISELLPHSFDGKAL